MGTDYNQTFNNINLNSFRKVFKKVLKTNKFYKEKLAGVGITSATQIKSWRDFEKIPLTTREDLSSDQIIHPPFGTNLTKPQSFYKYVIKTSGTSTGKPFYQPLTVAEFDRFSFVMAQGAKQLGVTKNDIFCYLGHGYALPLFYQAIGKYIGARVVPSDPYRTLDFLNNLKDMGVTVLQSSPSAIYELIEAADVLKYNLKRIGINKILTIGEPGGSRPFTKKYFQKKWGAKVVDHIGSVESGLLAVICSKTNDYHILKDLFIVEVFDTKTDKPARKGELVLTSLWRSDFPIIRYRTGDAVEIEHSTCICGLNTPRIVNGIFGRTTGQIKIWGSFLYPEELDKIIRNYPFIKDYRIVCRTKNSGVVMDIYTEVPFSVKYEYLEKLGGDIVGRLGQFPNIIPLLPKSLPRFDFRKGKRFFDLREGGDIPFKFTYMKTMGSKMFKQILLIKKRKNLLLKLLS